MRVWLQIQGYEFDPGRVSYFRGDWSWNIFYGHSPPFRWIIQEGLNIYVSWYTSELTVRLAPLNRFKPSSKIFYWPFQGGTSFVDLLCFCSVLCLLCLCARLFICALWSPSGKGLTSWLSFVVSTVSLSLSHWYPGSGVVLDCIDSWSLHLYLLCCQLSYKRKYVHEVLVNCLFKLAQEKVWLGELTVPPWP